MQPHPYTAPKTDRPDDYRVRPAAEPRSWAPRTADATFTHNAARYTRPVEAVQPVADGRQHHHPRIPGRSFRLKQRR